MSIKKTYIPAKPRSSKLIGTSMSGGIQAGTGGGSGGGMTSNQINILNNLASWWKLDDDGNLFTELNVYSKKEVSAYGAGSDSGGGGGTTVTWGATANNYSPLTVEGVVKTVALQGHTHNWSDINSTPATLSGYGITNAYTKTEVDDLIEAGGGGGTTVTWGATANNYSPLTVEGVVKTVALQGHTHNWSDINSTPATLSGYGITNAYTKTEVDDLIEAGGGGNDFFQVDDNGNLYTTYNLYSTKEISAYGDGGSGGSGGGIIETVYGYNNLGQSFSNSTLTDTFNAYTINQINTRLLSVEAGGGANDGQLTLATGTGLTGSASFSANQAGNSTFTVSPVFGTTAGTIAQGNDSRIINGQTAYGWGNHASAGYALASRTITAGNGLTGGGVLDADRTLTLGTPSAITLSSTNSVDTSSHTHSLALGGTASQYLNGATTLVTIPTITAGNGLSGGGQLTATRALALGTPTTLSTATTNKVTASSHTHSITTTSVGLADTIMQTNASGGTKLSNLMINNWSLLTEYSDATFVIKHGGANKMRIGGGGVNFYGNLFIQDNLTAGSIVSESDITAYEVKAYETVNTPKVIFNAAGWSMEQVGTELQMKHNGTIRMRFLSDGAIVAIDEITAFA